MKPLVTIALPVYNGAATLKLAVQSILEQSFREWELIILDDASTDHSLEVMRSFDDTRIHLVEGEKNLGLSARLNMAIDMANCSYFARMDQDDICYPDRIGTQLRYLQEHPDVHLLATSTMVFRGDGDALGYIPVKCGHEDICAHPWNGFYLPHPTWMGRTDWFREYRYDSSADGAEDQHLLLRAYRGSNFACLKEPLLGYRQNVRSLKKIFWARRIFVRVYLRHLVCERNYGLAMKVVIVSLMKVVADVFNLIFGIPGLRNRLNPLSETEKSEWQRIWNRLKAGD